MHSNGTLPTEFLIFAFGHTKTLNGDYDFDKEAANTVVDNAKKYGNKLTLDYEHQALNSEQNGQPAPAAGRFDLELRGDGLYAVNVQWTPRAAEFLRNKEYLYYSPAFIPDKQGRPKRLLNIALTNIPATEQMEPLVAARTERRYSRSRGSFREVVTRTPAPTQNPWRSYGR
jgi:phage I-like protein